MRPINRPCRKPSPSRFRAELLEVRRLFLTHTVEGTSVADAISIGITGNQILIVVNGVSDTKLDSIYDQVIINCNGGSDSVSIIATGDNQIIVNGGAGSDTLNAGNGGGTLSPIEANISFVGGTESDTLVLHDQNRGNTASYTMAGSSITVATVASFSFSTVELIDVNASAGNSIMVVDGLPTANLNFEGGTQAAGGTDSVVYQSTTASSLTLRPSATTVGSHSASWGSRTITASTTERASVSDVNLSVVTQGADDVIGIQGSTLFVSSGGLVAMDFQMQSLAGLFLDTATNDAGAGNDSITLSSFAFPSALVLEMNVGTGNNTFTAGQNVTLDTDLGFHRGNNLSVIATNGAEVTFNGAQSLKSLTIQNSSFVEFVGGTGPVLTLKSLSVGAGLANIINLAPGQTATITDAFSMTAAAGVLLFGDIGTATFASTVVHSHVAGAGVRVNAGTVRFDSDAGGTTLDRTLTVIAQVNGRFIAGSTQHLRELGIASPTAAGLFTDAGGDIVLVTDIFTLPIGPVFLDLNDNAMIVDYVSSSPIATIGVRVASGRAGGAWNGFGIRSTEAIFTPGTAIGFAEATDLFGAVPPGTTWLGEPIDATAVLLRHTIEGDANLDHATNFDDLLMLAANYNDSPTRWSKGDFNFDATTNFDDLLLLAAKYNASISASPAPLRAADVEPDDANGVADVLD